MRRCIITAQGPAELFGQPSSNLFRIIAVAQFLRVLLAAVVAPAASQYCKLIEIKLSGFAGAGSLLA